MFNCGRKDLPSYCKSKRHLMNQIWLMAFISWMGYPLGYLLGFLQIIPSKDGSGDTLTAYLISAIVALVGTVSYMFIYSKSLNKIIKTVADQNAEKLQEVYKEQIKDYKSVTEKNTEAFNNTSNAIRELSASNKSSMDTTNKMREWLIQNFKANV